MRILLLSLVLAATVTAPAQVLAAPAGSLAAPAPRQLRTRRPGRLFRARQALRRRTRAFKSAVGQRVKRAGSALSSLWKRGTRADGAEAHPADEMRILRLKIQPRTMGDWSTMSLLAAGANEALRIGTQLGPITGSLTGVGAIGLGVYSVHGLLYGKTSTKKLDAAHGVAWSLQGLTGLMRMGSKKVSWLGSGAMRTAGKVLGVGGGLLQAGLGGYRLFMGLRNWRSATPPTRGYQRQRIVLGSLDIGAGLCWAASACAIGGPWALGGFIGLSVARMGYNHKDKLVNATRRLFGLIPKAPKVAAAPKASSDKPSGEPVGPKVIVTKPTTEAKAAKAAQTPGVTTIKGPNGKKAVVTGATVQSNDGEKHRAVVVTPVEPSGSAAQ